MAETNYMQTIITWVVNNKEWVFSGGGIAVISICIAAIGGVLRWLFYKNKTSGQNAKSDNGGIARQAGRDNNIGGINASVNNGRNVEVGPDGINIQAMRDISINWGGTVEQVESIVRQAVDELAKNQQAETVPASVVIGVLLDMGEAARQWDQYTLIKTLIKKGEDYRILLEMWQKLQSDDPITEEYLDKAKEFLDQGYFVEAERLFLRARDKDLESTEALERALKLRKISAAKNCAAAAESAKLRVNPCGYKDAAQHYQQASELVQPINKMDSYSYRIYQALVLSVWGVEFGDNKPLEAAVALYKTLLVEADPAIIDAHSTLIMNNLAIALQELGRMEGNPEKLGEAVATYRQALLEYTQDRVPLDWASTMNNLANALQELGLMEGNPDKLEEAVITYRQALLEQTQDQVPLDWATTKNNLANALQELGRMEGNPEKLEEAVVTYRQALLERTRDRVPLDWATTMNNLANVLQQLGIMEGSAIRLQEAVDTSQQALLERTRVRVPLDWATTKNSLANALQELGLMEGNPEKLAEAVDTYRQALLERTRDRAPRERAETMNRLYNAQESLDYMKKKLESQEKGNPLASQEEFIQQDNEAEEFTPPPVNIK